MIMTPLIGPLKDVLLYHANTFLRDAYGIQLPDKLLLL